MCASIHNYSRIKIIEHDSSFYAIVCQHCESAPCIKICPTDAITDDGVNTEKCIGCGLCVNACSMKAIQLESLKAHADSIQCCGCQLCEDECPTNSIKILEI